MEPFKNLLGFPAAVRVSRAMKRAFPKFDEIQFQKDLKKQLEPLELKQRMSLITHRLNEVLPSDPGMTFPLLMRALKKNEEDAVGLSGFEVWPLTQFIADYGLDDFDLSMTALEQMTQVFTAEFAIRAFLIHHEERTLRQMIQWTEHESEHLRRLASEGSRPLLPWGQKLVEFVKAPEKTWKILELLKNDPAKYVQKSVANHLNDHSKNHADWLIKKLRSWRSEPASTQWIIRHGTRTLVKKGHVGALALHGIKTVQLDKLKVKLASRKIKLGEALCLQISLKNPTGKVMPLIIDVEIHLLKANGLLKPKVFKGKKITVKAHQTEKVLIRVPLRPVTTRTYYPGLHKFNLLVNGVRYAPQSFELEL